MNRCVRDNDGRKLDHKTLETLRVRAVQQIENGARVEDVATLGLARSTVFGWVAKYREGGRTRAGGSPGAGPAAEAVRSPARPGL